MKKLLFLSAILIQFVSCVNQRQKSNITGRTDEVYFTPSDIRIKIALDETQNNKKETEYAPTPEYTGTYADRLHNFGSSNRFSYSNYQPMLMSSVMVNPTSGWSYGMSYGNYYNNSAYNPYCSCYSFYNPYSNPYYNPYMFSYSPFWYNNYYGAYGVPNNYSGYSYSSGNYGRRTGTTSPTPQNRSNTGVNNTGRDYNNNTSFGNQNSSSGSTYSGRGGGGGNTSGNTSTRRR